MNSIEIKSLTKQYRDITAVDHLDLEIRAGESFALLGVNGAGKTTVIRMLSCLTKPTSGDAVLCGHSICEQPSAVKSVIALSPQETAIAPNLTVRENLELVAGICGMRRPEAKQAATDLILRLHLTEVEKRKAGKLSGGWQRRLSIAMALIQKPQILFLDEPTLGLDVLARRELWQVIRALKGSVTMILTTHYLEEAAALCDRIAVLSHGRLRAVGTVAELLALTGAPDFETAFTKLAAGEEQSCEF